MINPTLSTNFLQGSQNIETNKFNALTDIYYYISTLDLIGKLDELTSQEKSEFKKIVQNFQNNDGGFGNWYRDISMAGSTRIAVSTLARLGAKPLNTTGAINFIERLQVSGLLYGNYGFKSSLRDRDADISSTYDAISTLRMLGAKVLNESGVIDYLKDHQNLNGGFGYQTNRQAGIIWSSTAIHTHRGVLGLNLLNNTPEFKTEAIDFLKNLQNTEGGFSNEPNEVPMISYTYNSVEALELLGGGIPRLDDIIAFIKNNQLDNGGFIEYALDNKEGIHTTYYAIYILTKYNVVYDKEKVYDFLNLFFSQRTDGGFGDYPGLGSNLRFSFDAVSVLNLIGKRPLEVDSVVKYINNLRNEDGGFGFNGNSDIETTYRSLLSLQLLGKNIKEPEKIIEFIRNCQNNDGGFGFGQGFLSRGSYTYRALRTLEILGLKPVDKDLVIKYLRSLQNPDGGFGNYFGEGDSDLGSTYRAIHGLSILDAAPSQAALAEQFILSSQNPDGGFRRSANDITAPSNISNSVFTYDAILGLFFLGKKVENKNNIYNYIDSLRNPDRGFAEKPDFTSSVSSTFTSLWSYFYLYSDLLNNPPELINGSASNIFNSSGSLINFTVEYFDEDNQAPEYIHLVLDSERRLMQKSQDLFSKYYLNLQLPVGNHSFYFTTSDGLSINQTKNDWINIIYIGQPPTINLTVNLAEGTEDTNFTFLANYFDPDNDTPLFVEIQFDQNSWYKMTPLNNLVYFYSTKLKPGLHLVKAKTSDGVNLVYSDILNRPIVFPQNVSKPTWETFLKIQRLIKQRSGQQITFNSVERSTLNGIRVWKVTLDDNIIYVNYDGTEIIDDKNNKSEVNNNFSWVILIVISMVIIIIIITTFLINKKSKKNEKNRFKMR